MVHVAPTALEIDGVHDTVGLLQQVQRSLILLLFDECVGTLIELGEHDWYLILGNAQLFVVVLVEEFVFGILNGILQSVAQCFIYFVHCSSLELGIFSRLGHMFLI